MHIVVVFSALLIVANSADAAPGVDVPEQFSSSTGAYFVRSNQRGIPRLLSINSEIATSNNKVILDKFSNSKTEFSIALAKAWKPDAIQEGVEATKNMLLDCQKETSTMLTTPLVRSNSQQEHCFRF